MNIMTMNKIIVLPILQDILLMILLQKQQINAMMIAQNVNKNGQMTVLNVLNVQIINLLFIQEIAIQIVNRVLTKRINANALILNVNYVLRKVQNMAYVKLVIQIITRLKMINQIIKIG